MCYLCCLARGLESAQIGYDIAGIEDDLLEIGLIALSAE